MLKSIAARTLGWLVDASDMASFYRPPEVLRGADVCSRRAIVRWGDGETSLALGRSTRFQRADRRLAGELRGLLRWSNEQALLCFPAALFARRSFSGEHGANDRMWAPTAVLMRLFARSGQFGDAFMFRRESQQSGACGLLSLFRPEGQVVVVSPQAEDARKLERWLCRNEIACQVRHVEVPPENAYDVRDQLMHRLLALAPPDVILFSAGPVGKVLVPALMAGWPGTTRMVDTGHFFDHLPDGHALVTAPGFDRERLNKGLGYR